VARRDRQAKFGSGSLIDENSRANMQNVCGDSSADYSGMWPESGNLSGLELCAVDIRVSRQIHRRSRLIDDPRVPSALRVTQCPST